MLDAVQSAAAVLSVTQYKSVCVCIENPDNHLRVAERARQRDILMLFTSGTFEEIVARSETNVSSVSSTSSFCMLVGVSLILFARIKLTPSLQLQLRCK